MGVIYNYLTVDGKSTLDFNVGISGGGTYDSPSRDVETIPVPGRNGELTIDNGRFNNINVPYDCFITRDFERNIDALRAFLGSLIGYKILQDTYHPEEYRKAFFSSGIQVKTTPLNRAGEFTLVFNCKPQRFLKAGDIPVEFDTNSAIMNFTLYEAKPLIRVYGTGTFGIGDKTVTITQADEYTDIDCDLMDAYKGAVNCNANVVLNSDNYPTLAPGENGVMLDGISRLIIYPRYYTI